jgi:dTDP-4-amino-4,6-dideoxygalactose transaminase
MTWDIPLTDVLITEDDRQAVAACLEGGWLTMGPRTRRFEEALASWTGAPQAVTVSSGTAALHLACRALELGPGDEVVVPALTFVATANAARYTGAEPVLCDVESPERPNLDADAVERCLSPRTRAVIAVHLCGYAVDLGPVRELCEARGVALIEDAAQAIGAEVEPGRLAGTVGRLGCLSFFSKKQLCVGEGGAVLTADEELAARVRSLRSHAMTSGTWDRHTGHAASYDVIDVGYNYRLDEPRAALGMVRLTRLRDDIERRRATVRRYRETLAGTRGLTLMWTDEDVVRSSHYAFPVLFDSGSVRRRVRDELASRGIQTTRYPALHTLSAFAPLAVPGSLPAAEAAADRHLALPLSSHQDDDTTDAVASAVRDALGQG